MSGDYADNTADLVTALADAIRPPPVMAVSEWADTYRFLGDTSPEKGKWHTSRAPYMREPMDRFSRNDPCVNLVVMMGTQMGKSEMLLNAIGYSMDYDPRPMMFVQSTLDTVTEFSKLRIAPMLEDTPRLRAKVAAPRRNEGTNNTLLKKFPGGFLKCAGANSEASLRSTPVGAVLLDEVDAYPADVEKKGNPVDLAKKRLSNFPGAVLVQVSTPTLEDASHIEAAYLETDQRKYWVPCPLCGAFQILMFAQLKWPKGKPREAVYECEHCCERFEEHHKTAMLAAGYWRADAPENDGGGRNRGYWVNGLYSPLGWKSWGDIAENFVKAAGDPAKLKVVVNTDFAETYAAVDGESFRAEGLVGRVEEYDDTVPAAVGIITTSVDVQDDRIEALHVGWGVGEESWHLQRWVFEGSPGDPGLWEEVYEVLTRPLDHELAGPVKTSVICVDSGAHTESVCQFVRPHAFDRWPFVLAIKGVGGDVPRPLWPTHPPKRGKYKVRIYTLGVNSGKDQIYQRLSREDPGPGYMHFRADECDLAYFKQLTAERRTTTTTARGYAVRKWTKPKGRANEVLDLWVYALAGLRAMQARGRKIGAALDRLGRRSATQQGTPSETTTRSRRATDWVSTDGGSWEL